MWKFVISVKLWMIAKRRQGAIRKHMKNKNDSPLVAPDWLACSLGRRRLHEFWIYSIPAWPICFRFSLKVASHHLSPSLFLSLWCYLLRCCLGYSFGKHDLQVSLFFPNQFPTGHAGGFFSRFQCL